MSSKDMAILVFLISSNGTNLITKSKSKNLNYRKKIKIDITLSISGVEPSN
jgi:hypothetical protein